MHRFIVHTCRECLGPPLPRPIYLVPLPGALRMVRRQAGLRKCSFDFLLCWSRLGLTRRGKRWARACPRRVSRDRDRQSDTRMPQRGCPIAAEHLRWHGCLRQRHENGFVWPCDAPAFTQQHARDHDGRWSMVVTISWPPLCALLFDCESALLASSGRANANSTHLQMYFRALDCERLPKDECEISLLWQRPGTNFL